ncbi:MAG: MarR family transcriptional regulator [Evtepia sp.]
MQKRAIGIELRTLNNLIRRYFENHCNSHAMHAITGTNVWIIRYILSNHDRNIYQRDLEEEFSITRSTASKVVNLMVQKGLIERHSVSSDARLKQLVLTARALDISRMIEKNGQQLEAVLSRDFSPEELAAFYSSIEKIKHNIACETNRKEVEPYD